MKNPAWIGLVLLVADTNNNNADWSLRCITPAQANVPNVAPCDLPVPTRRSTWGSIKMLYR